MATINEVSKALDRRSANIAKQYQIQAAPKTSLKICTICGFKKRGSNHDLGAHHTSGKNGKHSVLSCN